MFLPLCPVVPIALCALPLFASPAWFVGSTPAAAPSTPPPIYRTCLSCPLVCVNRSVLTLSRTPVQSPWPTPFSRCTPASLRLLPAAPLKRESEMLDSRQAVARCANTTRGASTASSSRRPRNSRGAGGLGFWLVAALVGSSCSSVRAQQQEDYDYGGGYQQQPPMRAG